MRIVFSVALSAAVLLSGSQAIKLKEIDDEVENLAQTELEQDGQSMPTINIIDNNRNMTGVAPSCGCGPMGGGPFQGAMSPNGAVVNSLGSPGANLGMGGMGGMGGNMMGQLGMGGGMGAGNAGAGASMGPMSFPNFMMAQTEEEESEQMASQTQSKACVCDDEEEE